MGKVSNYKVKIIKCKEDTYWYKNQVGNIFTVLNLEDPDDFTVDFNFSQHGYCIDKDDCEVVEGI